VRCEVPQFIYVKPKVINKYYYNSDILLVWMPVAIFKLSCNPRSTYITDCFISPILRSGLARLLLTRKVKERIELRPAPSTELSIKVLSHRDCTPKDFLDQLRSLYRSLSKSYESGGWSTYTEPSRLALAHIISPVKWILGPMEKLSDIVPKSIIRSLIEDMIKTLCIDRDKVDVIEWDNAYLLLAIDKNKRKTYLLINNKVINSETYSRFIFKVDEVGHALGVL
jgi:hypothetical protein